MISLDCYQSRMHQLRLREVVYTNWPVKCCRHKQAKSRIMIIIGVTHPNSNNDARVLFCCVHDRWRPEDITREQLLVALPQGFPQSQHRGLFHGGADTSIQLTCNRCSGRPRLAALVANSEHPQSQKVGRRYCNRTHLSRPERVARNRGTARLHCENPGFRCYPPRLRVVPSLALGGFARVAQSTASARWPRMWLSESALRV